MAWRLLFVLLLLFLIYAAKAFANPFPVSKRDPVPLEVESPKFGVSFSFEQAEWYGLDPKKTYLEMLDDYKFDWVRLPFFWDQMVDKNGNLKIEDLKWAISEAQKRNVKVVIALGAKTPYYPEFHLPDDIKSGLVFGQTIKASDSLAQELFEVDRKLLSELYLFDNIAYWQVENEPFLGNINNWKIDADLVRAEAEVIRDFDPKKRPIIFNHVGPATFDKKYRKYFEFAKQGDVLGVNAYFKTQGVNLFAFSLFGKNVSVGWPKGFVFPAQSWLGLSPDYENLAREAEKHGMDLWILEMQSEPYIRDEAGRDGPYSFSPADIGKGVEFLAANNIDSIGLWGVHFWQYKEKMGDKSWTDTVKRLMTND